MQWRARAASTAGVLFGHGPSSNVSTTSPGLRKSWLLKCSKPKPGPPVVSICTGRASPRASGLPGQDTGGGTGAGGTALAAGAATVAWATGGPSGAAWTDSAAAIGAAGAIVITGSVGGLTGIFGLTDASAAVAGAFAAVGAGGDNTLVLVSAMAARIDSTTKVQATITRMAKPSGDHPLRKLMQTN